MEGAAIGRGNRTRAQGGIRYWSRSDDPAWASADPDADLPFADAVERITELFSGEHEAFPLSPSIGVPGLDLFQHPHRDISRAHRALLRSTIRATRVLEGRAPGSIPVRVVDLDRSLEHTRALLASIALLVQATNTRDPAVALPAAARDGLVGEGLTDAYFTQSGWEAVAGIGAFYRLPQRTFGTRLAPGTGIDHLFRRGRGTTSEYVVVETKVCKGATPLAEYLLRQFAEERLREAGSETRGLPAMSAGWILDRLGRAFVGGALARVDYDATLAAARTGRLRRAVVVVTCPEYDRPSRVHAPDPDALARPDGEAPMADEVVTLRVPKTILTTLVADISSCRARSIAALLAESTLRGAQPWVEING